MFFYRNIMMEKLSVSVIEVIKFKVLFFEGLKFLVGLNVGGFGKVGVFGVFVFVFL